MCMQARHLLQLGVSERAANPPCSLCMQQTCRWPCMQERPCKDQAIPMRWVWMPVS
jgi:hypothetical protein